jgi:hypothetical protein
MKEKNMNKSPNLFERALRYHLHPPFLPHFPHGHLPTRKGSKEGKRREEGDI